MWRLVYRGEGETRLQRARLFCGGTDSYTEGETSLWRGRPGDSSTKEEARLRTILDAIGNVQNGPNTVCAEYIYLYMYVCMYVYMYVCM
jgi:hypothetical protein